MGDVHAKLMVYACEQINERLPADLLARVEETVSVDASDGDSRWLYPDVQVVEEPAALEYRAAGPLSPCRRASADRHPAGTADAASLGNYRSRQRQPRRDRHRSAQPRQQDHPFRSPVVPEQAAGLHPGPGQFGRNRLDPRGPIHLGRPRIGDPRRLPSDIPDLRARVDHPHRAELYPLPLREPLPTIRIPLRPNDTDILLHLQPLIDHCYQAGRYDKIDYRQPLRPPLDEDDQRWADAILCLREACGSSFSSGRLGKRREREEEKRNK